MANEIYVDRVNVNFGSILKAIGEAMLESKTLGEGIGSMVIRMATVKDYEMLSPIESAKVRLNIVSNVRLNDFPVRCPDGSQIVFNTLLIENLSVQALMVPVYKDQNLVLFERTAPDAPLVVKKQ